MSGNSGILAAYFTGSPLVRICGADLVEVMEEVSEVILRKESEGDRFSGTDAADGFQLGGGNAGDYVGEVTIVSRPQRDQHFPIGLVRGLEAYVSVLVVWREVQRRLQGGADESLVIVGRGVDQMPEKLLARPAARECGLGGFEITDPGKLWLGSCDHAQELFTQGVQLHLLLIRVLGWHKSAYALIWSRIARAAAAGSAASVMGRPTTMWLAPAAMASAGVATRAGSAWLAPAGRTPGVTMAKLWPSSARTAAVSRAEVTMPLHPLSRASAAKRRTSSRTVPWNPTFCRSFSSRLVRTVTPSTNRAGLTARAALTAACSILP